MPWPWYLFTVPWHYVFRICSNIFCNAYLVVMNCFSLWLCSMSLLFYSLLFIAFNFSGCHSGLSIFSLRSWRISFISWILGFLFRSLMSSVVCAFVSELANFSYNFLPLFFLFVCFTFDTLTAVHHEEVFAWQTFWEFSMPFMLGCVFLPLDLRQIFAFSFESWIILFAVGLSPLFSQVSFTSKIWNSLVFY